MVIDNRAGGSRQHRHERGVARRRPTATRSASPTPATSSSIRTCSEAELRSAQRSRPGRPGRHRAAVPGDERQPVPAKTLQEFIAYAKANPDKVSYAGAGAGTTPDLAGDEFARRAGLKLVVVPHRGTGPATAGGARRRRAGHVRLDGAAHRIRAQGRAARARRGHAQAHALYAGRADLRRAGLSRTSTAETWFALFAPRGTPQAILDQLNGYTRGIQDDPEISAAAGRDLRRSAAADAGRIRRAGEGRRGEVGADRARIRRQAD